MICKENRKKNKILFIKVFHNGLIVRQESMNSRKLSQMRKCIRRKIYNDSLCKTLHTMLYSIGVSTIQLSK